MMEENSIYEFDVPVHPSRKRRGFNPLSHYHAFVAIERSEEGWIGYMLTGSTMEKWPLNVALADKHFEAGHAFPRKPTHFLSVPLIKLDSLKVHEVGKVTAEGEEYIKKHTLQGQEPITWREYCEKYEPHVV